MIEAAEAYISRSADTIAFANDADRAPERPTMHAVPTNRCLESGQPPFGFEVPAVTWRSSRRSDGCSAAARNQIRPERNTAERAGWGVSRRAVMPTAPAIGKAPAHFVRPVARRSRSSMAFGFGTPPL